MVDVYNGWNDNGGLPEIKICPFCGSTAVLKDNGYERPVIDPDTGAYIDMDIFEGDWLWCECPECGATLPGADTPEDAIEQWNRWDEPPNAPLTLEELREMSGNPVWLTWFDRWESCYGLYDFGDDLCMDVGGDRYIQMDEYGKKWFAYRCKPSE